jgi:exodeoxyribonuclease V alpha subunit
MMDVTNHPASTIHRLFGSIEEGNCHLTGDLLIVDESSMIDVQLFSALINIIPKHMRVVIVGDKDQLPSIGPGKILADMIASGSIPSTTLSMIHRRYDGSLINQISYDVNHGIMPEFSTFGKDLEGEAYFIDLFDPSDIVKKIEYLATEYLPKTYGYSPADIMVLSPMNKNELGIWNLNTILQATINPPADNKIEFSPFPNSIYREGDLVIQRVNNYKIDPKGVFNGETGQILEIDPKRRIILVELLDRRIIKYDFIDVATNLSLNYAITIHRSQGSESKCVIMVMHDQHHIMLGRQLIYTGITRAKDKLFLLGTRTALAYACGNATSQNRNSAICTSLKLEK